MDTNATHKGTVTFFSFKKRYGFIKTESVSGIWFYIDPHPLRKLNRAERKNVKYLYCPGDEVTFKVKLCSKSPAGYDAIDVRFVKHDKLTAFCSFATKQMKLTGKVLKMGSEFLVKDETTGLIIHLEIPHFLVEIREYCEKRVGQKIIYQVTTDPDLIGNLQAKVYREQVQS